ncbi:hypothetical protein IFM89_030586 [Coptis chinensis]|uniref:Orn/DAP/Arg decarboxylase 2 N-terminal domain-containing protein n=1 Tax=Coptis chinensis TaxID=261450 RepID=A0A835HT18_9MAGN|nr:hypothetical protein IFM89_030586 [Coptis chinensis]
MKGRKVTNLSKDGSTDFLLRPTSPNKQEVKDPFYVLDLGILVSLMEKWTRTMPIVRPFYLCQMQSEPAFLGALAALGAGFDCASRAEIEAVLALGVSPDRIVYANPCKAEAHIRPRMMVVQDALLVLSAGHCTKRLLHFFKQLMPRRHGGIRVSFHVGGGATHSRAYQRCNSFAKAVFDTATRLGMPHMHILNIGGGFGRPPI